MAKAPQNRTINVPQLLTLSLNGLDSLFFKGNKDRAKKLYKEIHGGETVSIASLTFKEVKDQTLNLKVGLDHSEYRGLLTFHIFKIALGETLKNIAKVLNEKGDLNIFSSDQTRDIIVHLPGVIRDQEDNINVMVLGLSPSEKAVVIKLQFLDAEQFMKKEDTDSAQDVPSEAQEGSSEETGEGS